MKVYKCAKAGFFNLKEKHRHYLVFTIAKKVKLCKYYKNYNHEKQRII